jgi:hypothetical protein
MELLLDYLRETALFVWDKASEKPVLSSALLLIALLDYFRITDLIERWLQGVKQRLAEAIEARIVSARWYSQDLLYKLASALIFWTDLPTIDFYNRNQSSYPGMDIQRLTGYLGDLHAASNKILRWIMRQVLLWVSGASRRSSARF